MQSYAARKNYSEMMFVSVLVIEVSRQLEKLWVFNACLSRGKNAIKRQLITDQIWLALELIDNFKPLLAARREFFTTGAFYLRGFMQCWLFSWAFQGKYYFLIINIRSKLVRYQTLSCLYFHSMLNMIDFIANLISKESFNKGNAAFCW